jgi:hypothetical protein
VVRCAAASLTVSPTQVVGRGGSAKVNAVVHRPSGKLLALKRVEVRSWPWRAALRAFAAAHARARGD